MNILSALRSMLLAASGTIACRTPGLSTLDRLGRGRTDKSSTNHCYLTTYARALEDLRQTARNVMEVGVFYGGSLCMWRDYFPNAQIVGVDPFTGKLGHGTTFRNATSFLERWRAGEVGPRIRLIQADQARTKDLKALAPCVADEQCFEAQSFRRLPVPDVGGSGQRNVTSSFDVVVDDGSHKSRDQLLTMTYLMPLVRPGGVYIIEDIHTSLQGQYDERPKSANTALMTMQRFLEGRGPLHGKHLNEAQGNMLTASLEGCAIVVPFNARSTLSMTCICYKRAIPLSAAAEARPTSVLSRLFERNEWTSGNGYVRPTKQATRRCT